MRPNLDLLTPWSLSSPRSALSPSTQSSLLSGRGTLSLNPKSQSSALASPFSSLNYPLLLLLLHHHHLLLLMRLPPLPLFLTPLLLLIPLLNLHNQKANNILIFNSFLSFSLFVI